MRMKRVLAALALRFLRASRRAAPQTYPSRPIRIVVPLPPGANGDLMPRILAQHLSAKLGQPVVIENRPGAAQNLGAELVFRAEPDGYTLFATPQGPLVISQSFFPKLGFDPSQFVPITIMAKLPYILVVHPKVPVSNFAEFIAYAKANPNKLNDASPSTGSGPHLTGEMLKLAAGIKMTHVPYSGHGAGAERSPRRPRRDDVRQSRQQPAAGAGGQAQGPRRHRRQARRPKLPDLPAIAETYPEVQATSWFAVVAPPKTPPAIAAKLSQAFAEILREPEIEKRWREMTLTPVGGTPEEIGAFFKEETERWRKVIVSGDIKPE